MGGQVTVALAFTFCVFLRLLVIGLFLQTEGAHFCGKIRTATKCAKSFGTFFLPKNWAWKRAKISCQMLRLKIPFQRTDVLSLRVKESFIAKAGVCEDSFLRLRTRPDMVITSKSRRGMRLSPTIFQDQGQDQDQTWFLPRGRGEGWDSPFQFFKTEDEIESLFTLWDRDRGQYLYFSSIAKLLRKISLAG